MCKWKEQCDKSGGRKKKRSESVGGPGGGFACVGLLLRGVHGYVTSHSQAGNIYWYIDFLSFPFL